MTVRFPGALTYSKNARIEQGRQNALNAKRFIEKGATSSSVPYTIEPVGVNLQTGVIVDDSIRLVRIKNIRGNGKANGLVFNAGANAMTSFVYASVFRRVDTPTSIELVREVCCSRDVDPGVGVKSVDFGYHIFQNGDTTSEWSYSDLNTYYLAMIVGQSGDQGVYTATPNYDTEMVPVTINPLGAYVGVDDSHLCVGAKKMVFSDTGNHYAVLDYSGRPVDQIPIGLGTVTSTTDWYPAVLFSQATVGMSSFFDQIY